MRSTRLGSAAIATCLVAFAGSPAFAQGMPHPNYPVAISDLNRADGYLAHTMDNAAHRDIDAAIRVALQAATDAAHRDGQAIVPADPNSAVRNNSRLDEVRGEIADALQTLHEPEANPDARALRDRAAAAASDALRRTEAEIARGGNDYRGVPHPESLHAISDLRAARAALDHPGPNGYIPGDRKAMGLIDSALQATGRVALYDGRRVEDAERAGVDATPSNPSHRHQSAREFLAAALHDLNATEDNPISRPYLDQARRQVSEAIETVRQMEQH